VPGARFVDVTHEAGLRFVHDAGASGKLLLPEIMGGGAALFDCDGDGDLDAFLTGGGPGLGGAPASSAPSRLFRQEDGRFTDVTATSGLDDRGYAMGVAVGDYDNDGDVDVYVTHFGPDRLYRNRGDGSFEDVTDAAGIDAGGWSASAVFFDYDVDGWLDLFVARYVEYDRGKRCTDAAGRPDYCSPKVFAPATHLLLHNDGDGSFTDRTRASGIWSGAGAGLGVVATDWNDDGRPDLYVANDGYANHLWTNRGDGTFRDDAVVAGAALDLHGAAQAGMGVLAADLDGDLDVDLFVTNLGGEANAYYRNLGGSRGFEDGTGASGLAAGSLPWTGFGTAAVDVELDGDLDLAVVNGRVTFGRARQDSGLAEPWNRFTEPKQLYLNDGAGRFTLDGVADDFARSIEVSRGLAAGDIDNDGDVDLLVVNVQGPARLYVNRAQRAGHWLRLVVVDPGLGGRDAIGARVTVVERGGRRRVGHVGAGASYLSSHDPRLSFGLGTADAIDRIEVRWPDGSDERFAVPGVDRELRVARGEGAPAP
jgi:hypothetical protein